jgi:hypothetical protein
MAGRRPLGPATLTDFTSSHVMNESSATAPMADTNGRTLSSLMEARKCTKKSAR